MAKLGRPAGEYSLRRTEDGMLILDLELAKRGLRLADVERAGVAKMTLRRLRLAPEYETRGLTTTLNTAYRIAAAIDPADPEGMLKRIFEVEQKEEAADRVAVLL